MKHKKYIYTDKSHPAPAIMGAILGVISLAAMCAVIYITYKQEGQTQGGYGVTGLMAGLFSMVGFVLGAKSWQNTEGYKFFPIVATIINLVNLAGLAFLVYWGTH